MSSGEPTPDFKVRRILIVGSTAPLALEGFFAEGLRALGVETTVFDPESSVRFLHRGRIRNRLTMPFQHLLVGQALEHNFDNSGPFDAVVVFKGRFIPARAIRECRDRTGVPWFNINPDSPFDPGLATSSRHIREAISAYDGYFIWSKRLVTRLEKSGAQRVVYLPFAHDRRSHFPSPEIDTSLGHMVTFVGTYDRERAALMEEIADLPIRVYGPAWENLSRSSRLRRSVVPAVVYAADLRKIVTSSLASINILRPQNAGSHNMRTFEVPAMGGLMVTTRSTEQEQFFPEGEASLMYEGALQLRKVVEALLRGDYDTTRIRARALSLSAAHDYVQRAKTVLHAIQQVLDARVGADATSNALPQAH